MGKEEKQDVQFEKSMPSPLRSSPPNNLFTIVGIGASAGGLEALETFFTHIPSDSGIAFVIIQHLSPKHKSIMGSLLSKYTSMRVLELEDGIKAEPNCVYINPPNKNVAIINGMFQLIDLVKTDRINLPIDYFFRSLSQEMGEKAISIILSGTATDGTLGIKAIKGEGGMVMVQSPESAKYDGMPRSAIGTGLVDYVLPVEQIPEELTKYLQHPYIEGSDKIETQFQNHVHKIFALIRTHTGHDFSHYKQTTIRRRIERRMAVHQIKTITDYVRYLQITPAEVETLFKEMLIGVTNFFRDTEAFRILKDQVIPGLIKNRVADANVRVWVVGCSTGEEAYSIAMIFEEIMDMLKYHIHVQVFASDIDTEAIDRARMSVYPDSIAADVSPDRLNRFFIKEDNVYKVKKQIREMVVFAVQNLIKDPPFSKIDLVSCRNLLIYMDASLQKKILPLFHYTLNPGGILFLGNSESIGEFASLFSPVDAKSKIFRRRQGVVEGSADYFNMPFYNILPALRGDQGTRTPDMADVHTLAEKIVLENYAPPCVLVNERYDILHFMGNTDKYLRNPTGKASFSILKMAREGLRYKLNTALHSAARQKKTIHSSSLRIRQGEDLRIVDIEVRPLTEFPFLKGFMMVIFKDKTPADMSGLKKDKASGDKDEPITASLEQELQSTKESLQTAIEEFETSNEELKSTNEELQSVNEELQSTNEELETSKEELQSTNEELVTVNTELQKKVNELSEANNDINNLLASTEIGTIFLDTNLCIKRFTPAMTKIFNLIQSDIGRPISHITSNIQHEKLYEDAENVLRTLIRKEMEIQNTHGAWYVMRIGPYRTMENVIDGVVITFVDIDKIKQAEEMTRKAQVLIDERVAERTEKLVQINETLRKEAGDHRQCHMLYDNMPVMLLSIDQEGCVSDVSEYLLEVLGYERKAVLGKKWAEFMTNTSHQHLQEMVMPELLKTGRCKNKPCQMVRKSGEVTEVLVSATSENDEEGNLVRLLALMIEKDKTTWISHKNKDLSREASPAHVKSP